MKPSDDVHLFEGGLELKYIQTQKNNQKFEKLRITHIAQ